MIDSVEALRGLYAQPKGQMRNDQTGTTGPAETQEQMVARYAADL